MNTKNNKRSQNTDEAIIRAAFETMLMGGKQISRITVREICEKAGINRSTFYAHYTDVFDLFERVELHIAEMCSDRMETAFPEGFRAMMKTVFEFILEYKDFYQIYYSELSQLSHLMQFMVDPFREQIDKVSNQDMGFGVEGEAVYHFRFFTAGISSMIGTWLAGNCRETPDQICDILLRIYSENSLFSEWIHG